jgi:hypothetical protein
LDLVSQQAPTALSSIQNFLEAGERSRWVDLATRLSAAGVKVHADAPAPFSMQVAAAKSLVLSACQEIRGVGVTPAAGLTAYAPEECKLLPGQVVIKSVDGVSPDGDPDKFFETVATACRTKSDLNLLIKSGGEEKTRVVTCTIPAVLPAPQIIVQKALP